MEPSHLYFRAILILIPPLCFASFTCSSRSTEYNTDFGSISTMTDNNETCVTTNERLEEYSPSYQHAFSMRYGVFIHWTGPADGSSGGIRNPDGSPIVTDIDLYAETFNVEKIADDLLALGFEYVIVTDFHGRGTMLHPSATSDLYRGPGYSTKSIDMIGEFILALKKRGIATILFTHPLDGHDYTEENREKLGWNDPTDNYKKWNDFINAMYTELVMKYGMSIMGIGFDSDFGLSGNSESKEKLDLPRLRQTILSYAPHLQLIALAGPNDCCEFGFKEVWRPSWLEPWKSRTDDDFDSETWPAYKRAVGIVQANHWSTIGPASQGITHLNAVQLYRYSILQAGAATEGPGVAWAASPYSTGEWEANIREVFSQVEEWTKEIRQSLRNVYPSTSYPTDEGTKILRLSHGIVATKSTDDSEEYIHVLNPPTDQKVLQLPLPKDGKLFTSARLLCTGEEVMLIMMGSEDGGILLELAEYSDWGEHNTVIALTVDPSTIPARNLALHKPVIFSSSEQSVVKWPVKSDYGSIKVNDGIKSIVRRGEETSSWSTGSYGWVSKKVRLQKDDNGDTCSVEEQQQWVGVDLEQQFMITKVVLYPNDLERHAGDGFPIEYTIEGSLDKKNWFALAPRGMEYLPLGVAFPRTIQFEAQPARYVRFVGNKMRAKSYDDKQLDMHIVEMQVFGE